MKRTFVLKRLALRNICLYNRTMSIEFINSNYTIQEKLQILADAPNMMSHAHPAVQAAGERKENSAMLKHVASVIALRQTEDVFLCSRS